MPSILGIFRSVMIKDGSYRSTASRAAAPSAVSGTEMDQKVPASAYSKSCLPSIGKCLLLHQFTFDTLREKCSVSYLKREEATKDSDIPADLQFSHLDTRDDYYLALRLLHCI